MADARHDFRTVLHYSILGGDPAVINLLLKQGATLELGHDYQRPTALDLAILKGDPAIVEMLLEAGNLKHVEKNIYTKQKSLIGFPHF